MRPFQATALSGPSRDPDGTSQRFKPASGCRAEWTTSVAEEEVSTISPLSAPAPLLMDGSTSCWRALACGHQSSVDVPVPQPFSHGVQCGLLSAPSVARVGGSRAGHLGHVYALLVICRPPPGRRRHGIGNAMPLHCHLQRYGGTRPLGLLGRLCAST